MPLVKAQCTNCGAILEVDSSKDAAICQSCGTPYIVEKAIQRFNINNTNYIENAAILSETEFQKLFEAAEGYLKLGKINDAKSKFRCICSEYPQKYEGWWGVVRCVIGEEMKKDSPELAAIIESDEYNNAKKVATSEQIEKMAEEIEHTKNLFTSLEESRKNKLKSQLCSFDEFRNSLISGGCYYKAGNGKSRDVLTPNASGDEIILSHIFLDNDYPAADVTRYHINGWDDDFCLRISKVEYVEFNYEIGKEDDLVNGANGRIQHCKKCKWKNWSTTKKFQIVDYKTIDEITLLIHWSNHAGTGIIMPNGHQSSDGSTKVVLRRASVPKGGCYIATYVYGSYDCPNVWTLRRYRDSILASTMIGRVFIKSYYTISPFLIRCFGKNKRFKFICKMCLDKFVTHLQKKGFENTKYYDR